MAPEAIVQGNWGRNAKKPPTPIVPDNTGVSNNIKASPQESNPQFKQGTDLAGSTVKLADGTDYQLKGAASGVQTPSTLAPAISPTVPSPTPAVPPPVSTPAPAISPTPAHPSPELAQGLDEAKLLASGVSQDQIDKIKLILNPLLAAQDKSMSNAEAVRDYNMKSLEEEMAMVEEAYAGIKSQRESITRAEQEIIDDAADVQKAKLEQSRQQELFDNSQAQEKYKLEQARNERETLKAQRDLEHSLARSLSASLGAAFSFNGMAKAAELQQAGIDMISDLQASTAYGMAEFSFKAQDIERFYTTATNAVEVDRRDQNIALLKILNDDLSAIDEKVLLSAQKKKEQARDTIQQYFEKKDEIDLKAGELISVANQTLFDEKEKLEQDARERQLLDIERSTREGYFVNKYGEYVSTNTNGTPKVFTGDINESLSKTLGYAVDSMGKPILDDKGNRINFEDSSLKMINDALNSYRKGTSTGYDNEVLSEHLGSNDYIKFKVQDGSYGGQCGTFVRTQFTNEDSWETVCWAGEQYKTAGYGSRESCSKAEKRRMVDERGVLRGKGAPKVGDVVIFDGNGYGSVGHYAIINEINVDGSWVLSESNLDLKGTVSNTRVIKDPMSDKQIYGTFTPNLKQEVISSQPTLAAGTGNSEEGEDVRETGDDDLIKKIIETYIGSKEEYESMKKTVAGRNMLQQLRESGLSSEIIDGYYENRESSMENSQFATSSISYPGRPKPLEGNAKYASAISEDSSGNVRIDWQKIDQKISPADRNAINWPLNMQRSEDLLNMYEQNGVDTGIGNDFLTAFSPKDELGQAIQKALQQKVLTPQQADIMAARMRWTEAVLRKTSGAAISIGEYISNGMAYFPQPGSLNKENLRQMRQALTLDYVNGAGDAGFLFDAYLSSSPTFAPILGTKASTSPITKKEGGGLFDTMVSMIWGDEDGTDKYYGLTNEADKKVLDEIYASDNYKNGEITDENIKAALYKM